MSAVSDRLLAIVAEAEDKGATSVHLKVPNRPLYRLTNGWMPSNQPPLEPRDTLELGRAVCELANREIPLHNLVEQRLSFGVSGRGRYIATLFRQRGTLALTVERVPTEVPPLRALGVDPKVSQMLGQPGLWIVAGGKKRDSLLSSLVTEYNASRRGFVVLLEEPLAALHRDGMASISQREIGNDVDSFAEGIRSAVRQKVDMIVVSRITDAETADAALSAAEQGASVLAAVPAPTAADAPWWLARLFHGDQRRDAELRITRSVKAILGVPDGKPAEMVLSPSVDMPELRALVAANTPR
jgi:twitching motility protein PilT